MLLAQGMGVQHCFASTNVVFLLDLRDWLFHAQVFVPPDLVHWDDLLSSFHRMWWSPLVAWSFAVVLQVGPLQIRRSRPACW